VTIKATRAINEMRRDAFMKHSFFGRRTLFIHKANMLETGSIILVFPFGGWSSANRLVVAA
jgi:hypothetical protein